MPAPSLPNPSVLGVCSQVKAAERDMGRAAVAVAAEEMVALQWQHHSHPCPLQAHEVLRCIHSTVEHVCSEPARHSLRSLLRVLAERFPEDTVRSLLRISPHCDSAAVAMWEAMLSPLSKEQSIFEGMLRVIQGSAPEEHVSAASRVLRRLSQSPHCQQSLKLYYYPDFLMALLDRLARAAQTLLDDQRSPLGCAIPLPCHSPGPRLGPLLCM
ncbi:uncharacterized protein [Heliangelus exortis]|uniref:uncharacterized protein n=1 Tax=Heliangelus exortis TaxID=472823 RepID=UPI003A8EB801